MRRFTLVQDIGTDVDEHWRLFMDEEFDRNQYLEGFKFPKYELLERKETDGEITRKIRVVPKLDLPGPVAKLLGSSFAYVEEQTFDKKTKTFRAKTIPSVLADRLTSESLVRAEPAGPGRCRRTCELSVDARIFGVGGLMEGALEKNLRHGWEQSAAYMNAHVQKR